MHKQTSKRLFIALNLPAPVKNSIMQLIQKLRQKHKTGGIRWVREQGMHITMHFLGQTEEEKIALIKSFLKNLSAQYDKIIFFAYNLGAFPNRQNPRIIFLGCRPINGHFVFNLHKEIGEKLKQLSGQTDKRPWRPHITLARLKNSPQIDWDWAGRQVKPVKFTINRISLMESRLALSGAEYFSLGDWELGKKIIHDYP